MSEHGKIKGPWLKALPTWQELERRATPWQVRERRHSKPDPAYACNFWGDPQYWGAFDTAGGISDEEYARRAAEIRAKQRGTRFYDGFVS